MKRSCVRSIRINPRLASTALFSLSRKHKAVERFFAMLETFQMFI